MDTQGNYTFFPVGCTRYVAFGADGNIWFMLVTSNNIEAMTTQGIVVKSFPSGFTLSGPSGEAEGSDGIIYMPGPDNNPMCGCYDVYGVTTSGVVTIYSEGSDGLGGISNGPDGNLWINAASYRNHSVLYQFVPSQGFRLRLRPPDKITGNLSGGPDGNEWLTGSNSSNHSAFVATYILHAITLKPWTMSVQVGHTANISVSETSYSSQWTAVAKNLAIVSVTPNSQNGVFTVTGLAPGSTVVTVYDTTYNSAQTKVTVTP